MAPRRYCGSGAILALMSFAFIACRDEPNQQRFVAFHELPETHKFKVEAERNYGISAASDPAEDQQKLEGGAGEYGQQIRLATESTNPAGDYTQAGGVNIGFAIVDIPTPPGPIAASYAAAKLKYGQTCFYLRQNGGSWGADTASPNPQTQLCDKTLTSHTPDFTRIKVFREQIKSPDGSLVFADVKDYPAVGRLEDGLVNGVFQVVIGVACGNAWCHVGVSSKAELPEASKHVGHVGKAGEPPADRFAFVPGWYDDQLLAVDFPRSGGGTRLERYWSAQIVPIDFENKFKPANYEGNTAGNDPLHGRLVARIYAEKTPPKDSRYDKAGFQKGWNELYILYQKGAPQEWKGFLRTQGAWRELNSVKYRGRGLATMPGTVRWGWSDFDEDAWIPCDEGCCTVQF